MIGFLTGEVVQFPWGARGQMFAALSGVRLRLGPAHRRGAGVAVAVRAVRPRLACDDDDRRRAAPRVLSLRRLSRSRRSDHHAAESARASAAKSEFLATVSHELRTPLNIIVGYTDLLLEGAFGEPGEQLDALSRIHQQSRQLLDLIQSMLDINRIEAGGISLVGRGVPVADRARQPARRPAGGVVQAGRRAALEARTLPHRCTATAARWR